MGHICFVTRRFNNMGHICFVTRRFNRQDSLIVHRHAKSLVEDGFKTTYIVCDGKPSETKYGIQIQSVNVEFKGFFYRLLKPFGRLKKCYENIVLDKRILNLALAIKADVYQINDFEHLSLGLRLKKKGEKVVYNLREYYPDFYSRKYKNPIVRRIAFFLMERKLNKVARSFDGIFNCMPEMHDYIKGIMPCKYFVDVANYPVVNSNFTLTYQEYLSRKNVISYFGTIYNISCQDEFLDAIKDLPIEYLLAGRFPTKDQYQRLIKHPAWNQVRFIDGFRHDELPNIINSSIIGNVMKDFSLTETPNGSFSIIKIFETMEACVPVILAKVPLYEQMNAKYHCGICVDPRNSEEIRQAIIYLLENKEEAYEMGQNGRRAVLEEFSWDTQYKNYLFVIMQLITGYK